MEERIKASLDWILRYVPLNYVHFALWCAGVLAAKLAAERYFGVQFSNYAVAPLALGIMLAPVFVGAAVVYLLLRGWERRAAEYCRKPGAERSFSDRCRLERANDRWFRFTEKFLDRCPKQVKAGTFLAFALREKGLETELRLLQINAGSDSAESDLGVLRLTRFYEFQRALCTFVASRAACSDNGPDSEALVLRCVSGPDFDLDGKRFRPSLRATFLDGPGFLSTLHFLTLLSLWVVQPRAIRAQVGYVYENLLRTPGAGWLTNRIFELTVILVIRGVSVRQIEARLKPILVRLPEVAECADPDRASTLKYELRNLLLAQRSSF